MDFNKNSSVVPSNVFDTISTDPAVLAEISSKAGQASNEVATIITSIENLVTQTEGGTWDGADADAFRSAAADVIASLNNFNEEVNTDANWTGRAGTDSEATVQENTSMMSNI